MATRDEHAATCPMCGQPNGCAMAGGRGAAQDCESCWCREVRIDEAVLAQLPDADRGRACLCRSCATGKTQATDGGGV